MLKVWRDAVVKSESACDATLATAVTTGFKAANATIRTTVSEIPLPCQLPMQTLTGCVPSAIASAHIMTRMAGEVGTQSQMLDDKALRHELQRIDPTGEP